MSYPIIPQVDSDTKLFPQPTMDALDERYESDSGITTGVDEDGTPTITVSSDSTEASITTDPDGTPVLNVV